MAATTPSASGFNYKLFLERVSKESFQGTQKGPLSLRLMLLDSFIHNGDFAKRSNLPKTLTNLFEATPGTLTIVDLTDPFVDPGSACALFDICLSLFLEDRNCAGKIVALVCFVVI